MNGHVRKFAAGEFAKQSQELLNELAKAMLCLTDTRRKREYDARWAQGRRRRAAAPARWKRFCWLRKVIDADQLEKARKFATAVGLEIRDAVVQQKLARPDVVMPAYAESVGLPYLDVTGSGDRRRLMRHGAGGHRPAAFVRADHGRQRRSC